MLLPMKPKSSSNLGKLMRANGIFKAKSRFRSSGTPAYRRRSEAASRVRMKLLADPVDFPAFASSL
jgi:hypothetical protein